MPIHSVDLGDDKLIYRLCMWSPMKIIVRWTNRKMDTDRIANGAFRNLPIFYLWGRGKWEQKDQTRWRWWFWWEQRPDDLLAPFQQRKSSRQMPFALLSEIASLLPDWVELIGLLANKVYHMLRAQRRKSGPPRYPPSYPPNPPPSPSYPPPHPGQAAHRVWGASVHKLIHARL